MGALVICVLAIGAGGVGGAILGSRLTRHLLASTRERIARSTVILLGGASGALIAAQLDQLVRQLEAASSVASSYGFRRFTTALETLAVGEASHGILLYGGILIALAAIITSLATRGQPN